MAPRSTGIDNKLGNCAKSAWENFPNEKRLGACHENLEDPVAGLLRILLLVVFCWTAASAQITPSADA
jgi:hypothetical protein